MLASGKTCRAKRRSGTAGMSHVLPDQPDEPNLADLLCKDE